jgi:hypothetical protein
MLALSLLFDFLDAYRMDYTRNVFEHESNLKEVDSRESLYGKLGLKGGNKNMPALLALINKAVHGDEKGTGKGGIEVDSGAPRAQTAPKASGNVGAKAEPAPPAKSAAVEPKAPSTAASRTDSQKVTAGIL